MREYKTLKALRQGETIDFEGVPVRKAEGELEPGDTYIGERNTGPRLLTVKRVVMAPCGDCREETPEGSCPTCGGPFRDYVVPKEMEYAYDYFECVKVEILWEGA